MHPDLAHHSIFDALSKFLAFYKFQVAHLSADTATYSRTTSYHSPAQGHLPHLDIKEIFYVFTTSDHTAVVIRDWKDQRSAKFDLADPSVLEGIVAFMCPDTQP